MFKPGKEEKKFGEVNNFPLMQFTKDENNAHMEEDQEEYDSFDFGISKAFHDIQDILEVVVWLIKLNFNEKIKKNDDPLS